MLAHGKLASPYLYPNANPARVHSAPASKTRHVGGAGPNANTRRDSLARVHERNARMREFAEQRLSNTSLAQMMRIAESLNAQATPDNPDRIALQWAAQAIAKDVAARFAEKSPPTDQD